MLSFVEGGRREFLRVGAFGLGAALASRAAASPSEGKNPLTGKTVVFLFMQGGPSQFETFDPKPDAPEAVRTVGGTLATRLPGVRFGETFPRLAALADRLAVVRNFRTGTQHGGLRPIVGQDTNGVSFGAIYNRVAGVTHPETGVPSAACLFPNAVDKAGPGPRDRFGRFDATGALGSAYAPFVPGGGGPFQENLRLRLPSQRLEDRRVLVDALDGMRRDLDGGEGGFRRQAVDMLVKGVGQAFDLSREPSRAIARYDTSHFLEPALWGTKKNGPSYTAHVRSLGRLLLLSRRLAEAGCGFVTINTEFVWDMHADGNNVGVEPGMKLVGRPFDHAVSAFVEDVEARGLSDKVMLICCGEMGRTPRLNKNGGRDHWPALAPLLIYGGGTNGQAVGRSTKDGGQPDGPALEPKHLLATMVRQLIDVGVARVTPGQPRDVQQLLAAMDATRGVV